MPVLTEEIVKQAVPPAGITRSGKPLKDTLVRDSEVTGFCLRISAKGAKTFFAEYTAPAGKRRVPLGRWGTVTVKQARVAAKAVLAAAAAGRDPFADRRAAEAAERARAAEVAFTVDQLIKDWIAARADQGRRPSYLKAAEGQLRKHLSDWLKKPASAVTQAEAMKRLDEVKKGAGPIAANRTLAYARAAWNWSLSRQLVQANPFGSLEAPAAEVDRERTLTLEEVALIWHAADKLPAAYRDWARVLLLTGARRTEVAAMKWSELSPDGRTWLLPSSRAKNSTAHVVHLAESARVILAARERVDGCPFVFPGEYGRQRSELQPISAFGYAKAIVDAEIAKVRAEAEITPAALPDWTWHDFRRSITTWAAGAGFPPHVADRQLNHVGSVIGGVAGVYQKFQFLEERKTLLDGWAEAVTETVQAASKIGQAEAA